MAALYGGRALPRSICFLLVLILFVLASIPTTPSAMAEAKPGGVHDSPAGSENSVETDELARFAVDEHNRKANALLEFVQVVKVKQQVVAGTIYYITLEANDGSTKKLYEAKVWVKPWMNFKELQEFNQLSADTAQG